MITIKFSQISLVVFAACMSCAIGQDDVSSRLSPISQRSSAQNESPNGTQASPIPKRRSNSVDDYLSSLPSLTANGQLSSDASKSGLIPTRFPISPIDSAPNFEKLKPLTWMTPNICYGKPYFNDDPLERYGQTHGFVQPAYSISRLLIQTSVFPVRRTLNLGRSIDCVEAQRFSSDDLD